MPTADLPHSPAADRNKAPLLALLSRLLPPQARVLEVASGTGQHAAHFAAAQPGWHWQPTEADAQALPVIAARCAGLGNVAVPQRLDVLAAPWPAALGEDFDAVFCANLLHIAPWPACASLMAGASQRLRPGGALLPYGPWLVDGEPTAPGNLAFDADLRARDPRWGLRRLADAVAEAGRHGLGFEARHAMPADNLTLVFRQAGAAAGSMPRR